jgi:DnaJ-class molecular chaperone
MLRATHGGSMARRFYDVLGLNTDASAEEVKRAFRSIARTCHPDVAGDVPEAAERFKAAREAYETLVDPEKREAYDRPPRARAPRRPRGDDSFFRAVYRRATVGVRPEPPRSRDPAEQAVAGDLDGLFADFGFGGASKGADGFSHHGRFQGQAGAARARRGNDLTVDVEVPTDVAGAGGPWTVNYARLLRDPAWTPMSDGEGVIPHRGAASIDVPVGARPASVKRYTGLGDAGVYGGPSGDLIVRFRVSLLGRDNSRGGAPTSAGTAPSSRSASPTPSPGAHADANHQVLTISVVEALLGGRVEVNTPAGVVKMTIPACTSSGKVFRLRSKGPLDAAGRPSDLHLRVEIVVPSQLDEASRHLIKQFAALHPEAPDR